MPLKKLELVRLAEKTEKPPLFEPTDVFWVDPYISKHILHAHLDPDTDDASRKPATIRSAALWIAEQAGGGAGRKLLDLGCGPGLYCREFAKFGFDVTGVDFSANSLEHARSTARRNGVLIKYLEKNYIADELPAPFDVVTLIYGDFCVLSDYDRSLLLWKVRALLAPGGIFVFDVFTRQYVERTGLKSDWYVQLKDGFWHPNPHLVLEQGFDYQEGGVYLNQYTVFPAGSKSKTYNIWHRYYTRNSIRSILEKHRLSIVAEHADLSGKDIDHHSEWIGIVARCRP